MAAVLFRLPQVPVLDSNGDPVAGAEAFFYDTGTLNLRSVYQDEALSIPHTNPVVANAAGILDAIYLNSAYTYRLIVKDADGATLFESDPYADISGAAILAKLLTVDGSGSGLDADKLDGSEGALYALLAGSPTFSSRMRVNGSNSVSGVADQGAVSAILNLKTETAWAIGVGPAIGFSGNYGPGGTENTTFGVIAGVKANSTQSNSGGEFVFSVMANGNTLTEMLRISSSKAQFTGIGTTASAANAYIDNGDSNSLLRSTSSLQYKTDVVTMSDEVADTILELRPVTYKSLADADDGDRTWWGFIAEEAHEVTPELVHYVDGEPDGFQYERVVVALLSIVKRQEARIAALEAAS